MSIRGISVRNRFFDTCRQFESSRKNMEDRSDAETPMESLITRSEISGKKSGLDASETRDRK